MMTPVGAQTFMTGAVDRELLLRNEFLAAENAILRARIKGRLLLTKLEKSELVRLSAELGKKAVPGVPPSSNLRQSYAGPSNRLDSSMIVQGTVESPVDLEHRKRLSS